MKLQGHGCSIFFLQCCWPLGIFTSQSPGRLFPGFFFHRSPFQNLISAFPVQCITGLHLFIVHFKYALCTLAIFKYKLLFLLHYFVFCFILSVCLFCFVLFCFVFLVALLFSNRGDRDRLQYGT